MSVPRVGDSIVVYREPHSYCSHSCIANDGAYVHISRDCGATWELTVPLEIAAYQAAFNPQGTVESKSGDLLLALGSHDHDPHDASFLVRSRDQGRSWQERFEAARV